MPSVIGIYQRWDVHRLQWRKWSIAWTKLKPGNCFIDERPCAYLIIYEIDQEKQSAPMKINI